MMILALALQATNCTTIGNTTRCEREGSRAPMDYGAVMRRAQDSIRPLRTEPDTTEVRRTVGNLVAAKECEKAREVALKAGDLDLAEQAERLCR